MITHNLRPAERETNWEYVLYADKMASVIGLAPIRPDLKGRLRELLCIHGQEGVAQTFLSAGPRDFPVPRTGRLKSRPNPQARKPALQFDKWPPRLVLRQRLLVFSEALICLSYSGKMARRAEARRAKAGRPDR
jgi:hypothetical protein